MKQFKPWLLLAGALLVLAACGGGGGGGEQPPVQADPLDGLPIEATQSVSGWIDFLARLIKADAEEGRDPGPAPTLTAPASLPVDDASEPASPMT